MTLKCRGVQLQRMAGKQRLVTTTAPRPIFQPLARNAIHCSARGTNDINVLFQWTTSALDNPDTDRTLKSPAAQLP